MTTNTNRSFVFVGLLTLGFIGLVAVSFIPKSSKDDFTLPGKWKFRTGDNAAYSQPGFDDSKWEAIPVGVGWETVGYDAYDGIAWYRAKVVIPSSFKGKNPVSSALKIVLGKIDDADQTYVNGKLVGRLDDWQTEREYLIPADVIRWDQENTIAIRVNDLGGIGGLRAGPYALENTLRLSDILTVTAKTESAKKGPSPQGVPDMLFFGFKTPVATLEGVLKVRIFNPMNNKVVFKKEEAITVGNRADTTYRVNATVQEPGAYLM